MYCPPEDEVIGIASKQRLGDIGAAVDDGARSAKDLDENGILFADVPEPACEACAIPFHDGICRELADAPIVHSTPLIWNYALISIRPVQQHKRLA